MAGSSVSGPYGTTLRVGPPLIGRPLGQEHVVGELVAESWIGKDRVELLGRAGLRIRLEAVGELGDAVMPVTVIPSWVGGVTVVNRPIRLRPRVLRWPRPSPQCAWIGAGRRPLGDVGLDGRGDGRGGVGMSQMVEKKGCREIAAVGSALPCPAMSGADPCTGSNMLGAVRSGLMLPLAARPMPPVTAAARSVRMSPNRLSVTITSKRDGSLTRKMVAASTCR